MSSRVTLSDVAARAGVSQSAASKVFNDRADVSSATADKVRRAAQDLGYQARAPKTVGDQVNIWIMIGDTLSNYYAPQLVSGMLVEAQESGAHAVVSQGLGVTSSPPPGSSTWMANAQRSGAQAFIFVTTDATDRAVVAARRLGTPLVLVDPFSRPATGVVTVGATNFRGGKDATEHLIRLGHRRIAYVGGHLESTPGGDRLAGYLDALRHADLEVDPQLILPGSFNLDDGRRAVHLLSRPKPPTAIFAASDAVAFGVYDSCHERGIRIPEDVSVVGFDDALGTELVWPHLTTVRQPLPEMGRQAVRICVAAVRSTYAAMPPLELATSLVIRNSTAKPRPERDDGRAPSEDSLD